jgi:TetR/AcrR family transcriptional regulator, cholesterol catabolism regulator
VDERPSYDRKLLQILKAAAAVFAEKGYDRASIRDISAATGVSLSGLYYYFKSKEELLFLIQDHCFGTLLARLDQDLEGVTDPECRLRVVVRNHLRFFVDNMKEMKVLSHEADVLTGDYREEVGRKKRRYVEAVTAILRELRPSRGADLRTATFALFGMMNWIYTWYREEKDLVVGELEDEILHLFLDGFRAPLEPGATVALPDGAATERASIWRSR